MKKQLSFNITMLYRKLVFFCLLFSSVSVTAQISGKITDASEKGIPFCNVLLLRSSDSLLVTGSTTDTAGLFQLEVKDTGMFYISVNYVGYKKWESSIVTITDKKFSLDLGKIRLEQDAKLLKDVEVVAERAFMEHKIDRTVFNIQNSIIGGGLNGLELLKKLPGVTVDNNDEISVRGKSGILIMIDGRTSYMSASDAANYIRSLDASQIEKIEVITNPSSKYDASGSAIINIVLIKDKNLGLNAQVYGSYGQGRYNGMSGGFNGNYRLKKFNFFLSGDYFKMKYYTASDQKNIFNTGEPSSVTFIDHIYTKEANTGGGGRGGIDYFIGKNQTLGIAGNAWFGNRSANVSDRSDIYGNTNQPDSTLNTAGKRTAPLAQYNVGLNYKWNIDSTGKELSANADYINFMLSSEEEDVTDYETAQGLYPPRATVLRYKLPQTVVILAANVDYAQPVFKKSKLEAGIKGSNVQEDNNAQYWNVISGVAINDTGKTNHFQYTESIYAGYLNFSSPLSKKVEIQLGLRGEGTEAKGIQKVNDSTVNISYFKVFPTFFLNWKVDSSNTINVSYSRRIDRPDYSQLNPFRFYRNPYSYGVGNPYLRPQISDNVGIDYIYKFFSAGLGFMHMKDVISDAVHQDEATHITYTLNENLSKYDCANLLLSVSLHPFKWWSSNISVNTFYDHYYGNSSEGFYSNEAVTSIINIQNSVNLKHDWALESNLFYRTFNIAGYVVNTPIFTMDFGVRKMFAKGKGAVRLSCGDLFHTEKYSNTQRFKSINHTSTFYSDSQRVRIALSWKLGKSQYEREEKRKSGQEEMNRIKN